MAERSAVAAGVAPAALPGAAQSFGRIFPQRTEAIGVAHAALPGAAQSFGRIFPQRTEAMPAQQMQDTRVAFFDQMDGAVRGMLDSGRTPPELHQEELFVAPPNTPAGLVWFASEPLALAPGLDDPPGALGPQVAESVFEAPPSDLVSLPARDSAAKPLDGSAARRIAPHP